MLNQFLKLQVYYTLFWLIFLTYVIYHLDKLEGLGNVSIASKDFFQIHGDRSQLLNWERYGLRIGVSGGSISSTETAEVTVVALVGGQFVFPKKMVLV